MKLKKKILFIALLFTFGFIKCFGSENPFVLFDFNSELNIDSIKPVLTKNGYSWHEEKPSFSENKISGTYNVTCYENNNSSNQYIISILHTPISRKIYSFTITKEIYRKQFIQEAILFYQKIVKKYGTPYSGAIYNKDYFNNDSESKCKINIERKMRNGSTENTTT